MFEKHPLRVVIVGGSITGLTLAHCLDKAGIDYVLLESHQDILANLGASVALQPAGCRILDQLGIFDRIQKCSHDLNTFELALPGNFKMGYPLTAITRRDLLHALYTSLEDRSKVKTGARAIEITPNSSLEPHGPLKVTTESGEWYMGDVVVGADGTHGIVRNAMWRTAETSNQNPKTGLGEDTRSMKVDYCAIVGMTRPAEEIAQTLPLGPLYMRSHPQCVFMVAPNPDSTIAWFAIIKTNHTYIHPDVPRWSKEDVVAKLEHLGDYAIRQHVTFRDLWERTASISSTACHEGLLQTWSSGRITLHDRNTAISTILSTYYVPLRSRLEFICNYSYRGSRRQSLETLGSRFILRFTTPLLGRISYYLNLFFMETAVTLDYLPRPLRDRRAAGRRERDMRKAKMVLYGISLALLGLVLSALVYTIHRL
ncbi:hypothetical protein BDW74DRAFT_166899 [Aspergillus multicolor]|uniref:FAD-dependent oxidoreductase n=1 Tax=Aspergillus multicolor TaxID=41759 RepID=UPI003CCD8EDB